MSFKIGDYLSIFNSLWAQTVVEHFNNMQKEEKTHEGTKLQHRKP